MFRLCLAIILAVLLMPADLASRQAGSLAAIAENPELAPEVGAYETFEAARTIYDDVSAFCERNHETCLTGKALFANAVSTVANAVENFATGNEPSAGELMPGEPSIPQLIVRQDSESQTVHMQ